MTEVIEHEEVPRAKREIDLAVEELVLHQETDQVVGFLMGIVRKVQEGGYVYKDGSPSKRILSEHIRSGL
tara:strand:- start:2588 stop:2797 length:210 start_codon:yes stop_codon:yes gene_type:complete